MQSSRREIICGSSAVAAALLLPKAAQANDNSSRNRQYVFNAVMRDIERRSGGRLGVFAKDFATGQTFAYHARERFALCSSFKFLLGAAVLKLRDNQQLDIETLVDISQSDIIENSPITAAHIGKSMTIEALCHATITTSDNAAANLLLPHIGGISGLNLFLRSIGDNITRIDRPEPFCNTAIFGDPRDTSTPFVMTQNLQSILLGNSLQPRSKEIILAWLNANTTGNERLKKHLPANWRIGDKTGTGGNNTLCDIAIIYPPSNMPILISAYLTRTHEEWPANNKYLADVGQWVANHLA